MAKEIESAEFEKIFNNVRTAQLIDTDENWTTINPILKSGEIGINSTNKTIKIGDGTTAWNDLKEFVLPISGTGEHSEIFNDYSSNQASGTYSHAEGWMTVADGVESHAENMMTNAIGSMSHAEGYQTETRGMCSHAEGYCTRACGDNSHSEGEYSQTGKKAYSIISVDKENKSITLKTVFGLSVDMELNLLDSNDNKVENFGKVVSIDSKNKKITVDNIPSNISTSSYLYITDDEGDVFILGKTAHAEGYYTRAVGKYQHVEGRANIIDLDDKYVHIVGNGTGNGSEIVRSNAHTLDWDGNSWYQGNIKIGGNSYDDENAKEIATKEYVDKKFSDTETKETINLSLTYSGDGDDNSVWAKCWGTSNMAVKCADIPEGFISVDSGNIAGIRVDNEWLNWNTFITEDMIDTSIPNVIYINYQNGSAEPQPITRAAIVKLAGTYDNFQIYSTSANITFPESGIYLLDNHTISAGNDYTSSLNITISVSTSGTDINNPADYNGNEIEVFNRGICIGDSVTEGAFDVDGEYPVYKNLSYPTILKKITNMEITNAGISGTTSTQWYNASINSSTNSGTWNSNNEWVWSSSVSALDYSGYDFAIIHLGINDVLQVSDTNTIDTVVSNYETSVKNIISKLKEKSAGIKIFLCTIIPNYAVGDNWDLLNEKIKSIVTELDLVYLIDLTKYSKILNNTKYEVNHPTKTGYNQLAKELYAMISYEINKNLNDFNDINNTNITQKIKEYVTKEYVDNQNNTLNNLVSTKSNKQNIVVISRTDENVTSEYELVCNTYQRYIIEKELTKLTLTMPEVIDVDYNFEMSIQIENVAPTWVCSYNPIKWHGVDCDKDGVFVPQSNTIYEISMRYIGTNSEGNKMISARVGIF